MTASDSQLHDRGYRFLFQDPVLLQQLLTTCVDAPWVHDIDLSSIEPFSTAHIDKRLVRRDDDFVAKIRFRGRDAYLVILLEFQSTPDRFMALRLLTYQCLVWASILDLDPNIEYLPPVFPLVLYNGDQPWTAPLQVADLADPLAREHLAAYVPTYAFHLIDEHAFPKETLELAANFISVIFTVETAKAEELTERLDPAVHWLHSLAHAHLDSAQRVLDWIRIRLHQDNRRAGEIRIQDITAPEELESMLDRTIRDLKNIGRQEGRQEGWQAGRQEGEIGARRKTLLRLLRRRFGGVSAEIAARLEATSDIEKLDAWLDRVVTAQTIDDVGI